MKLAPPESNSIINSTPSQPKSRRVGKFVYGVVVTALMVALVVAAMAPWWLRALGKWTIADTSALPAEVDAIVVLAGDNGRLEEGIRLFQQGIAHELWHTGFDDGVSNAAASAEIPPKALRILPSGTTWEDAGAVSKAIRETRAKRLLVITSWYHGRRAQRCLEKQAAGLDVTFYHQSVAPLGHDHRNWWKFVEGRYVVLTEIKKGFYYLLAYGVSLR